MSRKTQHYIQELELELENSRFLFWELLTQYAEPHKLPQAWLNDVRDVVKEIERIQKEANE